MQTFKMPLVQTPEDRKRAKEVRDAEALARTRKTPTFVADGLGVCRKKGNADDFTDMTRRREGYLARARAAAVCDECPFRIECESWAVATDQTGVFGGTWVDGGKVIGRVL